MRPAATTDEKLIERLRAGDLPAFDLLYERWEARLFGYIRRMIPDRATAEDVFQDVLFKVLRDRSFDPGRGRFSAWLFAVARNRCLEEHRKHERRDARRHLVEAGEPPSDAVVTEDAVERSSRVHRAMARLPEPQRQLVLLKQVGDLTYREIGEILGVAEGTIKSRLHAAMQSFRRGLVDPEPADAVPTSGTGPVKES